MIEDRSQAIPLKPPSKVSWIPEILPWYSKKNKKKGHLMLLRKEVSSSLGRD